MKFVDSHRNLLNSMMVVENLIFVKINGITCLYGKVELFVVG